MMLQVYDINRFFVTTNIRVNFTKIIMVVMYFWCAVFFLFGWKKGGNIKVNVTPSFFGFRVLHYFWWGVTFLKLGCDIILSSIFVTPFWPPFCFGHIVGNIGPFLMKPVPIERSRRNLSIGAGFSKIGQILRLI